MPRLIDPGEEGGVADAWDVDDLVAALDAADFDVRDEDSFAALGPYLARLGRNRHFLADLAIAELKDRCEGQATTSAYGAQVFLLRPANGRYVLRANFWPARTDAMTRASGTDAFFYDLPHDHNFPFLTHGYLGPGYWSDYYEFGGTGEAMPDAPAGLWFAGRQRLEPDMVMLYRAHRDVHVQLPPDSFSVSLNILGYDHAQPWRTQYRFDVERNRIAQGLTTAPSEALATLAVQFGGGNGMDLAQDLARDHPSVRMRRTALDALAAAADTPDARAAAFALAVDDPVLGSHARARLERIRFGP